MGNRDNIYAQTIAKLSGFRFDEQVADVFEDMIGRSVPGYQSVLSMFSVFGELYVQPDSNCFDLGCSLGAATIALSSAVKQKNVQYVAIDNSAAMISRCSKIFEKNLPANSYRCLIEDVRNVEISRASVVVLNYTLQFLPLEDRLRMLKTIYSGLLPGGVLVLSEKIVSENETENKLWQDMHLAFKTLNGYSQLEISQKRTALENVLIPETIEVHNSRLKKAGFSEITVWFRSFNFVSILAVK